MHLFINEIEKQNGKLLLGKGMYETLAVWEDVPEIEAYPAYMQDYQAAWKSSQKIVFSSSLTQVSTSHTVLKKSFDKSEIQALKSQSTQNIGIGGARLAAHALKLGLIDEIYHFVFPILVGSGKPWLEANYTHHLDHLETKVFENGVVMLHYRVDND